MDFLPFHSRTRTSISCKVTFVAWRFGVLEIWRGADFVAQQKMLPCAINDAVLRNKGVVGCARRLAGCGKFQGKRCPQIVTNFHKLICADMCRFVDRVSGWSWDFLAV